MRTLSLCLDAVLWAGVAATLWVLWSVQEFLLDGIRLAVDLMHF
jgi:hypothetical protein